LKGGVGICEESPFDIGVLYSMVRTLTTPQPGRRKKGSKRITGTKWLNIKVHLTVSKQVRHHLPDRKAWNWVGVP